MSEPSGKRPRVLVVDDYPDARDMYRSYLELRGFDVVEAVNGIEALQRALDSAPDVIVMDLSLPVMDGLAMIRELRKRPAGAGVPILFLTTESDAEIKAQAKAAGATGWLTKPFDPEQLVRVVKKVLAK